MSARHILHIVSLIVVAVGVAMAVSGIVALLYGGGDAAALFISAGVAVGAGVLANRLSTFRDEISVRESYFIVAGAWLAAGVFGGLPYLLSGVTASPIDALFESISGFTTTGASIFADPGSLPRGILFWRDFSQWLGGMGIIVLAIAILPFLGVGGMQLFRAEVPGPTPDRLRPRISQTAKLLWAVYVGLSATQAVLYLLGGMDLYDAVTHVFGTMPTGGFSPHTASIAAFDSRYIEYVTILFMYLAGVNFALHYRALALGRPGTLFASEEWRFYTALLLGATLIVFGAQWVAGDPGGVEPAVRAALFQVVSIGTTTGFATADYVGWPALSQAVLFFLMFVGGMAGSTAGGVKTLRFWAALKQGVLEIRKHLHPRAVMMTRLGGRAVPEPVMLNVLSFLLLFVAAFILGALLLAAMGIDLVTAAGASAASIGNIGPGLAGVGPASNYGWMPGPAKALLALLMVMGRLEIYTILVLFHPEFWRR